MSTRVKTTETKPQTLSEKAMRLLAAHDREAGKFQQYLASGRTANRWA